MAEEDSKSKCTNWEAKWRFEKSEERCKQHWWGGCMDNGNVFDSRDECEMTCLKNAVITDEEDTGRKEKYQKI